MPVRLCGSSYTLLKSYAAFVFLLGPDSSKRGSVSVLDFHMSSCSCTCFIDFFSGAKLALVSHLIILDPTKRYPAMLHETVFLKATSRSVSQKPYCLIISNSFVSTKRQYGFGRFLIMYYLSYMPLKHI